MFFEELQEYDFQVYDDGIGLVTYYPPSDMLVKLEGVVDGYIMCIYQTIYQQGLMMCTFVLMNGTALDVRGEFDLLVEDGVEG